MLFGVLPCREPTFPDLMRVRACSRNRPGQFALNQPAHGRRVPQVASPVLGGVSPDEDCDPSPSLLMMVLVGGRDRSLAEFRELARAAGLDVQTAGRQPSGRLVIECSPTSEELYL